MTLTASFMIRVMTALGRLRSSGLSAITLNTHFKEMQHDGAMYFFYINVNRIVLMNMGDQKSN